jgi:hypothetical protein
VTIYFGRSASALSRARYIFFYGWDSYILFKNGRPRERGNFSPRSSFISYDFISKEHFSKIEPQRLKDHIAYLASPELAGRFPETTGYQKAQTYLIKQLEEIGITPILQPFSITIKDVQECNLILYGSNTKEKLKTIPFVFSKNGKWEGSLTSIDQSKIEELDSLSGKGAMILLNPAEDIHFEQLLKKIKELQSKGAKAIFFMMKEENLEPLAPYLTYPSYFPPKLDEKLNKKERGGNYVPRLIEASKVVARAKRPDFKIRIPIFFVPYTPSEEERIKNIFNQRDLFFEVNLQFKEIRFKDANIGGIIEGHDPERRKEFLVLGAH